MSTGQAPIVNLQVLRFFAAIWVVFLHSRFFLREASDAWELPKILKVIQIAGFAGVDIFFVISGAIMALTSRELAPTLGNSLRFLLVRFSRIYTGWWPLFVLYWAGAMATHKTEDKWFFSSLFLLPAPLNHYVSGVLWTLSFELYFYCAVALLILAPKTWRVRIFAMLLIALTVVTVIWRAQGYFTPALEAQAWPLQKFAFAPLIAEFLAGFLFYEWFVRARPQRSWPWIAGAAIFFACAALYEKFVGKPAGAHLEGFYSWPERALLLGGFAVCMVGWALTARPLRGRLATILTTLGDASYAIYLSHIMVMFGLTMALAVLGWPARWQISTMVLLHLGVLAFSLPYHRWVELPLYQWCRRHIRQRLTLR